jgi:hypothetical protein
MILGQMSGSYLIVHGKSTVDNIFSLKPTLFLVFSIKKLDFILLLSQVLLFFYSIN